MISLLDVTTVLQKAWVLAGPERVPTQFPGTTLTATQLRSWFEFWVTQADEPPQRVPVLASMSLLIDVHCFSREPQKRMVFAMANQVREALSQQVLPFDPDDPAAGSIRIREAVVRDLTRESITEPHFPLQHVVVSLSAFAERHCGVTGGMSGE